MDYIVNENNLEIIIEKRDTSLAIRRRLLGYSQAMLAQKSGVPLRTIQQYESRARDINKASVQTLMMLARALECPVEEIVDIYVDEITDCIIEKETGSIVRFKPDEEIFKEGTEYKADYFFSSMPVKELIDGFDKKEEIFKDKFRTYEVFKHFYSRDAMLFDNINEYHSYINFLESKSSIVIKPVDSAWGKGVKVIDVLDYVKTEEYFKELFSEYKGKFLLEEKINQSEQMGKLHPKSVNTLRITTVKLNNRVEILYPFVRIGTGNNSVDNGGSGGILCPLDIESSKLIKGIDELGKIYHIHPDTNIKICGYEIPDLEKALELSKELAYIVPTNRYTGWDLAHTDKGWIMVEGNTFAELPGQEEFDVGLRPIFDSYLKEIS